MAPPDRFRPSYQPKQPGSGLSHSVMDLAHIRALVESTGAINGGSTCPSCEMPFDKGKKRRLIDSCGHERCYSCLFRSEACPLCAQQARRHLDNELDDDDDVPDFQPNFRDGHYFNASQCLDWLESSSAVNSLCGSPRPRLKFSARTPVQKSEESNEDTKCPKGKPPILPESALSRHKAQAMAKSCPTPPTQRRKFFLNAKALRSPFASRQSKREAQATEQNASDNPSAISAWMTTSWEGKSQWPGAVLGKIRSLWSNSQGSANDGLNQLIDASNKLPDDEGVPVKTLTEGVLPAKSSGRKSGSSDLYMRLGLLLGQQRASSSASVISDVPLASRPASTQPHQDATTASICSLTSLETRTHASSNTSPVSTLTGTSSEAEVAAAAIRSPLKSKGKGKGKKSRDCDSAGSLASISTSASTSMSMSMSVSVSGLSNGSSSPMTSRRHSVTTSQPGQIDDAFKSRRTCVRRSARTSNYKGSLADSKMRLMQQHAQLMLKPLFFEVPLLESDPLFTGRQWLLQELKNLIEGSSPGALISGSPGTGKTALVLQLVDHSCFGRKRPSQRDADEERQAGSLVCSSSRVNMQQSNEKIRELASHVVAYHFCQADNNSTCLVPDLIHSLAAQLCQAPQLSSYREYLLSEPHMQGSLSEKECTVDPDLALHRGIIEPLFSLRKAGRLPEMNMVILIDAVCEAEYHRPDRGDTIASFLTRHAPSFPSWLKLVVTVRSQLYECTKQLPYTRICLDKNANEAAGVNVSKDLADYIGYRLTQSPVIQANVTAVINGKAESLSSANQTRFATHLLSLVNGSFLFAKLTLDLLESGHLVAKSASYKVLPVSLAQIYLLHFNLRFPTATSFDKVQPILGVCLAALYPLTLPEIFYSVNSLNNDFVVSWDDFLQRFKMLSGFLVKRLDNTYMFFHPSFREWLMRRDEGESTKFLCDLRLGHAAIAFRLSRLQAPLDGEKALELGHHILKAHVYRGATPAWPSRDLQAAWLASSSECVSSALCTLRNVYSPNVKVSRLLLLSGASPNFITEYLGNAPALCMYAHEGSAEMVSLLLEFGADVELTNSQGCTALTLAAARGHCDVVRKLAAAGASLGHADMAGQCALVHAARHGHLSVVGYLLACDWTATASAEEATSASPPTNDVSREEAAQQAVVAAAAQGHESVVEYLLDMSEVVVDKPDTLMGETALTIAAANGSTATVSALLARGASPAVHNAKGFSALMLAAREGHWGTAERLLQGSLTMSTEEDLEATTHLLKQKDPVGRSALSLAASEGHTNLVDLLLDKEAVLEDTDKEGMTALAWACVRGRLNTAQCLIDRGADVNTCDKTGRTPLDLAAFQGNPKLVQLLLERGAAIEHVDLHGMRPLDRAIGCRNIPVVQCFLRRGAKLGPATWAMAAGKPDILLILLNKLLEDGNVLYRKARLKEASYRYSYALRKFPTTPELSQIPEHEDQNHMMAHMQSFTQLKLNFLLNLSRCKRKMEECEEAIELADEALKIRPHSYEAYYARAKAKLDASRLDEALDDIEQGLQVAPPQNRQDRRVLVALRDEIISSIEGTGIGSSKFALGGCSSKTRIRASVDTLTEL